LDAVFHEAVRVAREYYITWQGSFTSIFLMALQPGIFGEQYYIFTPYLLIISLIAATWLFARTIVGKHYSGVLCWLALLFSIQFAPAPEESFYWYNGGIYYTFFYSLSLVLYCLVLQAHRASSPAKRAIYAGIAMPLAFLLGGGNYVTALLSGVLLTLLVVYRMIRKDPSRWSSFFTLVCLLVALILSVVAPGNGVRQETAENVMPYGKAILLSFPHAIAFFIRSMRFEFLLGALVALPFVFRAAERHNWSFRYPALVTLASLCVYACQFTPHLAAFSEDGPQRMMGIIFFTNFWLIGGNLFYWCGWFAKNRYLPMLVHFFVRWTAVVAAMLIVLGFAVTIMREPVTMSGASAAKSLLDGSAKHYWQAQVDRTVILKDETTRNVAVPPLPDWPHVLMYTELAPDATHWINDLTAAYYGKESVSVAWPTE